MSARSVGRGYGVVVRCDADGCAERIQTANVRKSVNRAYAVSQGWGRRKAIGSRRLRDMCPEHDPIAVAELEARKQELAAQRAERAEKRKLAPAGKGA
jgi:hypothetical protein